LNKLNELARERARRSNQQKGEIKMKKAWFKRCGWAYLPVSWIGGIVVVLALAFCFQVFVAVDRHSHSASDTLCGVFPYFACCFLLLNWIAGNSSEHPR
jgi:hypothetical protein